jgi:DNA-binding MarR family transcriptional regulator
MERSVADPATAAWKAILELVGWGSGAGSAPRFPMVALKLDLSPKQLGMLWRLDPDGPGSPMRALAQSLYCDASYVTDLVDRLEERGLIVRAQDPGDRRVKLLKLTKAGIELRARALEMLYEPPSGFANLSASEQRTLAELLARATAEPAG